MSHEFRELDGAQLANVTGGGPILQWLASRPLRRWIMRRRGAAGGEPAASSGGGEAAQPSSGGEGGGE